MTGSSTVGRISHLERSVLLKLQAGCNYINAEVQKVRSQVVLAWIVLGVIAAMVYAAMWSRGVQDPRMPFFGAFALASLYTAYERRKLGKTYKRIVVGRVVNALGQGLTYSPTSTFTKQAFLDMDLFQRRCEQWKSEDEISGRRNVVTYRILEAHATRTEGSGKHRRRVTIFKGLIVQLDFNKHFQGHTVVVPDSESKILGGLFGDSSERRNKELCRMENVDFENAFSVYSTDQQEARYILTPKLMELIMEARLIFSDAIRLSFHHNSVFVTVPQSTDRFEVSLFGAKITPETAVGELAELVKLAERLVETLDLETRIWTRV